MTMTLCIWGDQGNELTGQRQDTQMLQRERTEGERERTPGICRAWRTQLSTEKGMRVGKPGEEQMKSKVEERKQERSKQKSRER